MTPEQRAQELVERFRRMGSDENRQGMARYAIDTTNAFGVRLWEIRKVAAEVGPDHDLSLALWETGNHEARLLATIIGRPEEVTEEQMECWVVGFDSWDICDQCCSNLFDRTPFAYAKALEWSVREEEYVKRAAFALMAALAVHDKKAPDATFEAFMPIIERESADDRNFVKKAVNWALRNIGKRNLALNAVSLEAARRIAAMDSRAARWVGKDALRELAGEKVQARLHRKHT